MATNQEKIDYLLSIKPKDAGITNDQKQAYLKQQQQPQATPEVKQTEEKSLFAGDLPFMDRGEVEKSKYSLMPSFGGKSLEELTENVYKSFDNIGLGALRSSNEATDAALSKYMGEITSMPAAIKGAEFAAKLPLGHPVLKGLAIIAGSATGSGIGQFFGELGKDVYNGTPLEYKEALDAGATTATWDAAGGLVLGTLGTISKKALRVNGIESTDDAVKAARGILKKYGADLSWYQATGSNMSSVMEGIGRVGLFGKETLDHAYRKQEVALQQNLDELFTPTTLQNFGENVQQVLADTTKALSKEYSPQYDAIYAAGENIPVNLISYNKGIVKQVERAAGAKKNKKAPSSNPVINDVNTLVTGLDDTSTMSLLNETLKELRGIKRDGFESKTSAGSRGGAYAQQEIKKLEAIMGEAAEQLDPALKGKLDFLNKNYAADVGKLKNKTMRVVAGKDPSLVGDWVYSNPTKHKDFMVFLGQAQKSKTITKEQHESMLLDYRSGYIKKQIAEEGATTQAMAALAKKLRIAKNTENLSSVLGAPTANRLKNILNTAELTQKHVGAKFGLVIGGQQAQAAKGAMLATAGFAISVPAAMALFTGPLAMAKAATSAKTMGEWLAINGKLRAAVASGDVAKTGLVMRRISQYVGEDEESSE